MLIFCTALCLLMLSLKTTHQKESPLFVALKLLGAGILLVGGIYQFVKRDKGK